MIMTMIETIHDHTVHPRYLDAQSQVLDLGANYGLFAKAITARFGCRCVAVEPSPEPFAAIAETPLISKLQAAAASSQVRCPFMSRPIRFSVHSIQRVAWFVLSRCAHFRFPISLI